MVQTLDQGIFVVDPHYYRGYDLKFTHNAHVIILDGDKSLRWEACRQMVGRGCRS